MVVVVVVVPEGGSVVVVVVEVVVVVPSVTKYPITCIVSPSFRGKSVKLIVVLESYSSAIVPAVVAQLLKVALANEEATRL